MLEHLLTSCMSREDEGCLAAGVSHSKLDPGEYHSCKFHSICSSTEIFNGTGEVICFLVVGNLKKLARRGSFRFPGGMQFNRERSKSVSDFQKLKQTAIFTIASVRKQNVPHTLLDFSSELQADVMTALASRTITIT